MARTLLVTVATLASITSCTKESSTGPKGPTSLQGRVVINEVFVSSDAPDWIELNNPGGAFRMEAGSWFLSDDVQDLLRFELPEIELPAQGYAVIQCDGDELADDGVHATFGLSARDRSIHLTFLRNDEPTCVDEVPVNGTTGPEASMGRSPDGSMHWTMLSPITPGAPNEEVHRP
jgi:hypothetical protein